MLSPAPARLLTPDLFEARRRAYELDQFIGGTVGKLYFEGEGAILPGYVERTKDEPRVRRFEDPPPEVQRLVDPTCWEQAAAGAARL